ncbi:hypothetical protein [Haloglycomyces albus]|uniref:hypothetical protein n=1 Tax=Haloglycomyces albus TaxID=526067 RepID=UPI00046D61E4|nr:hypothetical protein [Haloglycomyces albus]
MEYFESLKRAILVDSVLEAEDVGPGEHELYSLGIMVYSVYRFGREGIVFHDESRPEFPGILYDGKVPSDPDPKDLEGEWVYDAVRDAFNAIIALLKEGYAVIHYCEDKYDNMAAQIAALEEWVRKLPNSYWATNDYWIQFASTEKAYREKSAIYREIAAKLLLRRMAQNPISLMEVEALAAVSVHRYLTLPWFAAEVDSPVEYLPELVEGYPFELTDFGGFLAKRREVRDVARFHRGESALIGLETLEILSDQGLLVMRIDGDVVERLPRFESVMDYVTWGKNILTRLSIFLTSAGEEYGELFRRDELGWCGEPAFSEWPDDRIDWDVPGSRPWSYADSEDDWVKYCRDRFGDGSMED